MLVNALGGGLSGTCSGISRKPENSNMECQFSGDFDLPKNVKAIPPPLKRTKNPSRLSSILSKFYLMRFLKTQRLETRPLVYLVSYGSTAGDNASCRWGTRPFAMKLATRWPLNAYVWCKTITKLKKWGEMVVNIRSGKSNVDSFKQLLNQLNSEQSASKTNRINQ
jgi:hypothetical protein